MISRLPSFYCCWAFEVAAPLFVLSVVVVDCEFWLIVCTDSDNIELEALELDSDEALDELEELDEELVDEVELPEAYSTLNG